MSMPAAARPTEPVEVVHHPTRHMAVRPRRVSIHGQVGLVEGRLELADRALRSSFSAPAENDCSTTTFREVAAGLVHELGVHEHRRMGPGCRYAEGYA